VGGLSHSRWQRGHRGRSGPWDRSQRWNELDGRGEDSGSGKASASIDSEDVRTLRQKLRDVTEERDILKKALAYFADDQK